MVLLAIGLIIFAADFLKSPSAEITLPTQTPVNKPAMTELTPGSASLRFTRQKIEVLPESGDTLWTLAEEFYGDGTKWTVLAAENNLKNGRLTMGKTLTVSREISPKVISPERVYRTSFTGSLPVTLNLPGVGQLPIPAVKSAVGTSPDGNVIFDQNSVVVKNGSRTETYGVGAGLVVTDHFFADLNGQSYVVYLYSDPAAPTATDVALFNLTSLRQ